MRPGIAACVSASGPWAPTQLASLLGWFDAADLADGAVSSWTSRDAVGYSITQGTGSSQAVAASATGVTFDGTNDSIGRTTIPTALVSRTTVPDGSGAEPGRGFCCTGLDRYANGDWLVGNHGLKDQADVGTIAQAASIVRLSPDKSTVVREVLLNPIMPSSFTSQVMTGQASVQGVSIDSDETVWFPAVADGKVYHLNFDAGTLITGDTFTPSFVQSGTAIDKAGRRLFLIQRFADGSNIQVVNIAAGHVGEVLIASFDSGIASDIDSAYYLESQGLLFVSYGANGAAGFVRVYSCNGNSTPITLGTWGNLSQSLAIEGIHVAETTTGGYKLTVANDARYHNGSAYYNELIEYKATIPGFRKYTVVLDLKASTVPGTRCVYTHGLATAATGVGLGVYFTSTTGPRLLLQSNGSATRDQINWTVPNMTTAGIASLEIDVVAMTASLYINGTLISTQALTNFGASWHMSVGSPFWIGSDTALFGALVTKGWFAYADVDGTTRQKAEGFAAWRWGRQALLPSGHPYKNAAP